MEKLTRQQQRLINAGAAIRGNPYPQADDISFLASELVQTTLPYTDPGDVPIWVRYNGDITFTIQQGYCGKEPYGYPYGIVPRILLTWTTKQLLLQDHNRIYLGKSLRSFVRSLGFDPNSGGKRGDRTRVEQMVQRFFRAKFSTNIVRDSKLTRRLKYSDLQFAPDGEFWWDYSGDEEDVFDGYVDIGHKAAKMLRTSPVPLDNRALCALRDSCLAMDLYNWYGYKTYLANKHGETKEVPYRAAMKQLGCKFGNIRDITKGDVSNFRREAKLMTKRIAAAYPFYNIDFFNGVIYIHPSKLPLQERYESKSNLYSAS
ncbi:MAG: replication protein RepA [Filomicrobium sp.]